MNTGSEAKFNLSAWALKNQQMVSFLMLLVIAMGVFCYEKLPRNEDPAFTIKTAVVSAQWPGASVADTTRLLTDTLEKSCRKRPGWTISKVKPGPDAPLSTSTFVTIRPRNACRISGIRFAKKCRTSRRPCLKACRTLPWTTSLTTRSAQFTPLFPRASPCGRCGIAQRQFVAS